jgi:hypothetical protein
MKKMIDDNVEEMRKQAFDLVKSEIFGNLSKSHQHPQIRDFSASIFSAAPLYQ